MTNTDVPTRVEPAARRRSSLASVKSLRYVGGVAVIAVGYDIAAQGGEALLLTGPAGAFWPATGVGIAVLYLGGLRWWPGVLLGDLLSREFGQLPLGVALAETAGNLARALVATLILLRLVGRRASMDRLEQVGAVFVAVAVGEAISATVAMVSLRLGDVIEVSDMSVFWRSWWLGGVSGGLIVIPLALAWARRPRAAPWRTRRAAEAALMLFSVAGLSVIALSPDQPLTYIVFPSFIWAALRFGPQGATLALAVGALIAVWATANEEGAFVEVAVSDSALNLQLYITLAALTTLSLAAVVSERRVAASELAQSRARIVAAGVRERRRLEAELHDSAQNRLIALGIRLGLLRDRAEATAPDLVPALDALIDDADEMGEELRRIAHGVLPQVLVRDGLVAALHSEALRSAVEVRVNGADLDRSEEATELAVYLCCLESIQNAAKHAGPDTPVTVTLRSETGELSFSVRDTGAGFEPATTPTGAGLASIHDRIDSVGGHVDVLSAPEHGTTVAGVVPWPVRSG